jgi:hypothetical protein
MAREELADGCTAPFFRATEQLEPRILVSTGLLRLALERQREDSSKQRQTSKALSKTAGG